MGRPQLIPRGKNKLLSATLQMAMGTILEPLCNWVLNQRKQQMCVPEARRGIQLNTETILTVKTWTETSMNFPKIWNEWNLGPWKEEWFIRKLDTVIYSPGLGNDVPSFSVNLKTNILKQAWSSIICSIWIIVYMPSNNLCRLNLKINHQTVLFWHLSTIHNYSQQTLLLMFVTSSSP